MALAQIVAGNRAVISDVNQFYNLLKGVTGSGEAITLIHNAAASLIFQPSSDPAAGTEVVQIKNNVGTVQGSLTFDGKVKVADGTAALPSMRFQSEATGLFLSSAGVIGHSVSGATANVLIGSGYISLGATPATAGAVRLTNNQAISGRETGGTNIELIKIDAADNTILNAKSAQAIQLLLAGSLGLQVELAKATLGSATGGQFIAAGTLTAGGLLGSAVQVGTSGPLIYSGSGAPTISAAVKGSLYLRSDGSSGTTRAYIATDTAGTWTAINTVA